jgi:hypothetical protein
VELSHTALAKLTAEADELRSPLSCEPRKLTLKFMDDEGTSSAKDIGRLKFPLQRTWRYVFILEHPNNAGEPEPSSGPMVAVCD